MALVFENRNYKNEGGWYAIFCIGFIEGWLSISEEFNEINRFIHIRKRSLISYVLTEGLPKTLLLDCSF